MGLLPNAEQRERLVNSSQDYVDESTELGSAIAKIRAAINQAAKGIAQKVAAEVQIALTNNTARGVEVYLQDCREIPGVRELLVAHQDQDLAKAVETLLYDPSEPYRVVAMHRTDRWYIHVWWDR